MANTLISVLELDQLIAKTQGLQEQEIAIIDCRSNLMQPELGRVEYRNGHIPNARYADLNQDLSSDVVPGITGRHPLPGVQSLEKTLGKLGIATNQKVIAYDGDTGAYAARLWWLLRYLGHDQVWVLDGGYAAWVKAKLDTSVEETTIEPQVFKAKPAISKVIEADDIGGAGQTLLDAREAIRFRGEKEPVDPVAGHIPNAICSPFMSNLDSTGAFRSAIELREKFLRLGVSETEASICYCGSGVTACHNILALVHADFPEAYLYPGSWSEWIVDQSRPVATGA